ncbi:MAG: ATP-binding protein [Sulfitobacter sp.]
MSLASKLTEERRRRLAAERLLELKKAELFAANRKLGQHAQQLSEEIVETRAVVESMRGENQRVKSDLSAANERLALVERRILLSIDAIKDGFAFFDRDNELIMANQSYLSVFDGLDSIKPGVNYVTILQALTDEGVVNTGDMPAEKWRQMMTRRYQQERPEPVVIQLWDQTYYRLIDRRGPEGDMISLSIDISKSVAYEEKLKEARFVAESANRAKSSFLANMSHEIRTPMNGVIGMTDLLLDTEMDSEQRPYVETIKNSAEALLLIINDVLDYSKIEAEKLTLKPKPFDLEENLRDVLRLLQTTAQEKGVAMVMDCDLFLPQQIVGDPGRMRQILTNLIGNAVKFTSEGHVLVRVLARHAANADTLTLSITVEDTGIGIPDHMVDHIFGEFNQVEDERNRKFEGTGLGLAISQKLVEMMGGKIWVKSTEGVGTCFGFDVEVGLLPDVEEPKWRAPDGLDHVLVVDNAAVHREVLGRQFEQLGLGVTLMADAAEALSTISPRTDLILAAETLGEDAVTALAQSDTSRPLVVLSAAPLRLSDAIVAQSVGALENPPPRQELFDLLGGLSFERPSGANTATNPSPPKPRKMRILAAEDNKTNQLVLSKMIKDLNIELTFAGDGEEAVTLHKEIAPDLIFMDISMPKMDGKQATAAIRADEGEHRTPIVALTAHALPGDDDEIIAAGLDGYLTKPLRKPLILEQIEAAHAAGLEPLFVDQAVA